MSTEPFIGEIKALGFNFAPKGYANCWGQIMSISQNTALYALLGTTYGGNGVSTFALPNLGGRIPLGQSTDGKYVMGQMAGTESMTLISTNMPMHVHSAIGISMRLPGGAAPDTGDPTGAFYATMLNDKYAAAPIAGAHMGNIRVGGTTSVAGGSQPFNLMNPFLGINYSIAIYGIFPSRD